MGICTRPDPSSLCIPGTICFPHHEFEPVMLMRSAYWWNKSLQLVAGDWRVLEESQEELKLEDLGSRGSRRRSAPGGSGSFGSGSCCWLGSFLGVIPSPAGCSQKCLWSLHPTGQTRPLALWPWDCGACGLVSSILSILTLICPWLRLKPWYVGTG